MSLPLNKFTKIIILKNTRLSSKQIKKLDVKHLLKKNNKMDFFFQNMIHNQVCVCELTVLTECDVRDDVPEISEYLLSLMQRTMYLQYQSVCITRCAELVVFMR